MGSGRIVWDDAVAVRERAAEAVRDRIARHGAAADKRLRTAFVYLADNLFDPELTVGKLKNEPDVVAHSFSARFADIAGLTPSAYLARARFDTARTLLESSAYSVETIAQLVGLGSGTTLWKLCQRFTGSTPSALRRRARLAEPAPAPPATADDVFALLDGQPTDRARRARRTLLDAADARAEGEALAAASAETAEKLDRDLADAAWQLARDLKPRDAALALRRAGCQVPAVYEHMLNRIRSDGRRDRTYGVKVAKLIIDALPQEATGALSMIDLVALRAHAWAGLGNAHCLASDPLAARPALDRANELLAEQGSKADPLALAETACTEARLLWILNRHPEALVLVDRAISGFEAIGKPERLARAILSRAAILKSAGRAQEAMPCLERAQVLAAQVDDAYLQATVAVNLAFGNVLMEDWPASKRAIARSRELAGSHEWIEIDALIDRAGGLYYLGIGNREAAESCLRRALGALSDHGDLWQAAVVAVELADMMPIPEKRDDALALLEQARTICGSLGAATDQLQVERLIVELQQNPE